MRHLVLPLAMGRCTALTFVGFFALLVGSTAFAQEPAQAMRAFLATLSGKETAIAQDAFESPDRLEIRFTPGRRGGLSLKSMDAETRKAALHFLESALSHDGMTMIRHIRQREEILGRSSGNPDYRDPDLYYLAVFGEPGQGDWGFRFEGHHLSINMTYRDTELVSGVPVMLASNPEKTNEPDAPPELLGPLVETARKSVEDPASRMRVIEGLTAHIPGPLREAYRAELASRSALSDFDQNRKGFALSGGGVRLEIETNQSNHIHITFSDKAKDFGGKQ